MCFKKCCLSKTIKEVLEETENYNCKYQDILLKQYKIYKFKKIKFYTLRFIQTLLGLGLTTLTTVNNPYFKDNVDTIGIMIWYISISNNITNLLLEKMHLSKFSLFDDKLKVKLIIGESKKYKKNYRDYSLYKLNNEQKLDYLDNCCEEIVKTSPYEYLVHQGRRPSHNSFHIKQKKLDIEKAWEDTELNNVNLIVEEI